MIGVVIAEGEQLRGVHIGPSRRRLGAIHGAILARYQSVHDAFARAAREKRTLYATRGRRYAWILASSRFCIAHQQNRQRRDPNEQRVYSR
jgi:hypothetical protein